MAPGAIVIVAARAEMHALVAASPPLIDGHSSRTQWQSDDADDGAADPSAPAPTRTGDLQVRSLTLYPAELRARAAGSTT